MGSQAPFSLVRCFEDDLDELTQLCYDCFPGPIRKLFMGCGSPAKPGEVERITDTYKKASRENPNNVWIGVKDNATGKFVAGANWRLFVNGPSEGGKGADEPPDWLDGETLEASKKLLSHMDEARARLMPGPFIHLHICFTHPSYRRRGAGGMLLKWGCDLADMLFIPGYIEASSEGNFLYKTFGFYDLEQIEDPAAGESAWVMKRDARKTPIYGGKAAPS